MDLSTVSRHVLGHWQLLARSCGDRRVEVLAATNQQRVGDCSVVTTPASGQTRLVSVSVGYASLHEDQVLFEGWDDVDEERREVLSAVVQEKVGARRYALATTLVVTRRELGWKKEGPIYKRRDHCVSCRDLRQDTGG